MDEESLLEANFSKIVRPRLKNEFSLVHKQLFEDHDFSIKLNATERGAWEASENVCGNFLGKEEAGGLSNVKAITIALNFKRK
jgi:hypothetical protein